MPTTYVLKKKDQCQRFFEFIDSEDYFEQKAINHILFMEKLGSGVGAHGATGVKPFDDTRELAARVKYDGGNNCGDIEDNIVMQAYIPDPLLIEGHKFDIRSHFLVASTNPLIVYYFDGYLRISPFKFDANSDDVNVHLSNTHEAKPDETSAELNEWFTQLNFSSLCDHLYEKKIVKDPNYLETGLRYRMKRGFMHLLNSTIEHYAKRSNLYEMFGCDFLLDKDLNMWFIECNSDPSYSFPGRPKAARNTKMLIDHFEIIFGYLRSRLKRVMAFVNGVIAEVGDKKLSNDALKDLLKPKKHIYQELFKNILEPEFALSKENQFVKIIDDNLSGSERYSHLVPPQCLPKQTVDA
jgi:hypothetical protein